MTASNRMHNRPPEEPVRDDEHFLPPRKRVHPTEKEKWTRIFYRTLLWLFIALVVGLLGWGAKYLWEGQQV